MGLIEPKAKHDVTTRDISRDCGRTTEQKESPPTLIERSGKQGFPDPKEDVSN